MNSAAYLQRIDCQSDGIPGLSYLALDTGNCGNFRLVQLATC